jgi:hypothetical protein
VGDHGFGKMLGRFPFLICRKDFKGLQIGGLGITGNVAFHF